MLMYRDDSIRLNETRGIPHPQEGWGWIARRQLTMIRDIIKLVADPPD
ncbi:hypothetical protein LYNGBM3L_35550 [Moorena producens 3L]|uniref:Uncharacterized protein n=1 Tax=Moorena producens 3L TaxID=489825 RepID=F4XUQ8_9CYAN|nr:hypothetical protein LYNGBM3L_35550 [Moorena producens 3L]